MVDYKAWNKKQVSVGIFLICFIIVGIPFWSVPYSRVTLPNSFFGLGVVAVFVTAALLCLGFRFSVRRSIAVAALVFPSVLMARVVVEATLEPGRHNLWPLALVIAGLMGGAVAGAGAFVGWLAGRVLR